MPPPALQLFPPPPPPNQRRPVQQWPQRTTSRKNPTVTVSVPSPIAERRDSGKSPVDIHELVIRVDSPAAAAAPPPAATAGLPGLEMPKRAHIVEPRIPSPQQTSNNSFSPPLPPRARSVSPYAGVDRPRVVVSPSPSDSRVPPGTAVSPVGNIVISPSGTNIVSPTSIITSPISPDQKVASPALSGTTAQSLPSPPPMRSMFPRYDPELSLNQQPYKPTQSSPTHIPMSKISRPLYSPTNYTPYAHLEHEDEVNMPAPTPYYTPASMLDSLWDATNGQGVPVVQTFTLQMHRHAASKNLTNEPQISFGPSPSQPFYTLSHTDIPPGPGEEEDDDDDDEHELLIRRHHPTKATNIPITHLTLSPTPTTSKAGAARNLDPASIITTVYPKLAALNALDIASNSPAAAHIAAFDPDATSDAAQRLAEDVLRGTAERECCALVWTRTQSLTPAYTSSTAATGSYALHHPSLGVFNIAHDGDTSPGLSPVLGSLPFSTRAPARANNRPTTLTLTHPSHPSTILAKLDFGADTLVLNVAALLSFGNAYLIDVLVSALLAVALAEEKRLRKATAFAAPPVGAGMPYSFSTAPGLCVADEAKIKRKRLFRFMKAKAGVKEVLPPSHMYKSAPGSKGSLVSGRESRAGVRENALDKEMRGGIEMGSVTALPRFDGPGEVRVEDEKMPFVTRTIVTVLGLGFKAVVWVLTVTFKIVAGVVVKTSTVVLAKTEGHMHA